MKTTLYSGVPASGKTSLIKSIIQELGGIGEFDFVEEGLVKYHKHKIKPIIIFGVFVNFDETFVSTDKWSMAVQPVLIEWIKKNKHLDVVCLGEGDRIYTKDIIDTFLKELSPENFRLILLKVSKEELHRRHVERNDTQEEKFLRGRETKYRNILDEFDGIEIWSNENLSESEKNKQEILRLLGSWKSPNTLVTSKEDTFF